jgi:hypothetical protein
MRRGWIVLLAVVLVAALALPAMADIKASGFYRSKAYLSNFNNAGSRGIIVNNSDAETSNAFVEQRFRVKWEFGNENVKAVWYLESDNIWGDAAGGTPVAISSNSYTPPGATTTGYYTGGAARNSGGALGADRINTETKNIYIWFKIPDTSMDFQVGLQNQSDDYAGLIYGAADMAGIFMNGKFEPVKYKFGWAKLYENNSAKTDDQTLYYGSVNFVPTKDATLGVNFYFLQDDTQKVSFAATGTGNIELPKDPLAAGQPGYTNKVRVYMPGIDGAIKVGPATISGFFMYQFGKLEAVNAPGQPDIDITAYIADLRGDMKVGPGNAFIEGLYLSGGDNPADKYKAPITLATREASPGGNSAYSRNNSYILMSSPDTINVSQCLIGCSGGVSGSDPGNGGRGIWVLSGGYKQKITEKITGQANVGYLSATKMLNTDNDNRKEDMGTEINARVDYNLYKGLDVGLVGAYVFIGDFYKNAAGESAKDPWTTYARINYSF